MRLGTLREGGRDGTLVVIGRDDVPARGGGAPRAEPGPSPRFVRATGVAPTVQAALDDWDAIAPRLRALADRLDRGELPGEPVVPTAFAAPLPRAYEWLDASAFLTHVRLARKSRGAEPPPDLTSNPLVYQGGSGVLLGPRDAIALGDPAFGLDFEGEIAVILGDVPARVTPAAAAGAIRLVCLVNDVTLRALVPEELAKGFGFVQSKPPTAFAPFAVTPDELGPAWRDGRAHLEVTCWRGDTLIGRPHTREMHFSFPELVAHVARTRPLTAGTVLGSGTISNEDPDRGVACLVEARMRETIAHGHPRTEYLRAGERVRIEARDGDGQSPFGTIEQEVHAP